MQRHSPTCRLKGLNNQSCPISAFGRFCLHWFQRFTDILRHSLGKENMEQNKQIRS